MINKKIIVRGVKNQEEIEKMLYIRWLVLRKPLGKDKGSEKDKYDNESFQIIAINNNRIVGCARLRKMSLILGSIAYVAVLPEFQNQGIGSKIINKLIEKARNENLEEIKLGSRCYAVNFYKKLGFIQCGEIYDFLGIPHIHMILKL